MFPVTDRAEHSTRAPGGDPDDLRINPLLEHLAHWLDEAIPIPGTPWRIGLDGLIGLVPVAGDLATLFAAVLMLREARRLGVSPPRQALMVFHYALDALVGMVPLLGDVLDFAIKANKRGLDILKAHVEEQNRKPR